MHYTTMFLRVGCIKGPYRVWSAVWFVFGNVREVVNGKNADIFLA